MMPNLLPSIYRFEETLQFQIITKTVDDGDVIETSKVRQALYFEGMLQPLHPKELLVKPEGERKFKWWNLFTDLDLEVDSVIKDSNERLYRVMASNDWEQANFHQYQLIEGPGTDA